VHEWDTFAVVVGGSAGALVGLLFVAISIHAQRIAGSADLRGRSAQTLVIFASLLLIALLMVCDVKWADFALVPIICAATIGGLASAWLLMTKLTD
jgi:hypothetical protein